MRAILDPLRSHHPTASSPAGPDAGSEADLVEQLEAPDDFRGAGEERERLAHRQVEDLVDVSGLVAHFEDLRANRLPSHCSQGTKTSRDCISTRTTPSPSQASQRPPARETRSGWPSARAVAHPSSAANNSGWIERLEIRDRVDRGVRADRLLVTSTAS